MLLEDILNQAPDSPAVIMRRETYGAEQQAALVRDVLALANSGAGEIRHLLFGAAKEDGGIEVCGLGREAMQSIRQLVNEISELIEPRLQVTPLFAELEGKQVAVLEISGCTDPPYTLRHRIAEDMRTGACWVRDLEDVRPARRDDLDRMYARRTEQPHVQVEVGLGTDPACKQLCLNVPDTSQPPSQSAREQLLSAINAKKTANKMLVGDDTSIARLAHVRIFGADTPFVQRGMDTLIGQYNAATDEYDDADLHYYFEQQAVKLQLVMRNCQPQPLDRVELAFSLPQVTGFELSDRLYSDARGEQTAVESRLAGYPEVRKSPDRATVHVSFGSLLPGQIVDVFEVPLRLRVGPEMRGMKVALKYRLRAGGLREAVHGRLKLVFAR